MEIAARIVRAASLDEVDAGSDHVVRADWNAGRRMSKAAIVFSAIARAVQKLTAHLEDNNTCCLQPFLYNNTVRLAALLSG